jgi:hypothetical protein
VNVDYMIYLVISLSHSEEFFQQRALSLEIIFAISSHSKF